MAHHLDLEEQEQLDQLKHFWKQYGNAITWALTLILGAFAAWNGYQYWQNSRAAQAAVMFDEVERIVASGDAARIERALTDIRDKFSSSRYAQQAGLAAAKALADAGKQDAAIQALEGVAASSTDAGLAAIARLRLAALWLDAGQHDKAMAQLGGAFPAEFAPLVDDRRGDVLMSQGKKDEAAAAYLKAYGALEVRSDYRRLLDVKLAALGRSVAAQPSAAAGSGQ